MHALSLNQIRHAAPSVFATEPYTGMSERYRFFSTAHIVEGLMQQGFLPVRAQQSRARSEAKREYTKHMLRFRHQDMLVRQVNEMVPEIVLTNSHDGTSCYKLSLGLFRVVCLNGLVVSAAGIEDIKVRHSGKPSLVDDVIEASYTVIDQAPKAIEQATSWQEMRLEPEEQLVYAEAAASLRDTALMIPPAEIVRSRRADDGRATQSRDLWRTLNVVQENLIRGGRQAQAESGRWQRLRAVTSVDGDVKLNQALWRLTEGMAALKRS